MSIKTILLHFLFFSILTHASPADNLREYLFKTTQSYSALIKKDSKIIFEEYADSFGPQSKQLFWSCTKSVMGTLVGIAIQEKKLRWDQSVCEIVPEVKKKNPSLCAVTVEHLMFWNSGIDWSETYEKAILMSDVIEMLYGKGHSKMPSYVLSQKLKYKPGTHLEYSSGDAVLLGYLLRKVYSSTEYENLVTLKLSRPLGLKNFLIEKDSEGNFVASSYLYSTAQDMARFGELYLQKGLWQGDRLLSEEFISKVTQRNLKFDIRQSEGKLQLGEAGQWFVNQPTPQNPKHLPWPDWPADTFAAQGHWGQVLVIVPSKKIIFVRTGDDRQKEKFNAGKLGKTLLEMGVL